MYAFALQLFDVKFKLTLVSAAVSNYCFSYPVDNCKCWFLEKITLKLDFSSCLQWPRYLI